MRVYNLPVPDYMPDCVLFDGSLLMQPHGSDIRSLPALEVLPPHALGCAPCPLKPDRNSSECDTCTCALSALSRGQTARVHMTHLSDRDAAYLRALGLRENSRVRICQRGQPCIVEVLDVCNQSCRVGLARSLADKVLVEQVPS